MIEFNEFPSLSLESPYVVTSIQSIYYLYEENESVSSLNELRYSVFTKKYLGVDCLPQTLESFICVEKIIKHLYGNRPVCQY